MQLSWVGMLMLGNLMKECGVVDRIQKTAGNELMNIITIFLALSVGCTTSADTFLNFRTLFIIVLGLIAFSFGTAAGVLCGKVMYMVTGGQVNPLIGSAGVSAVPMAARVSQKVGQSENPQNFLLMHAMGPNVAGVIGSAVAAGILMTSSADRIAVYLSFAARRWPFGRLPGGLLLAAPGRTWALLRGDILWFFGAKRPGMCYTISICLTECYKKGVNDSRYGKDSGTGILHAAGYLY